MCLRQREGERASCTVKPSSTVLRDCPICLSINTQTNTHTHTHKLMHTHGPSVVLSDTHGVLHTQWGLSRQLCAFSDVLCEGNVCLAWRGTMKTPRTAPLLRDATQRGEKSEGEAIIMRQRRVLFHLKPPE